MTDGEAWLVVVDMQHIFGDADSEWTTPGFDEIVPRIRALAEQFGDRVVFTRFLAPERPQGAWVDYYRQWPFALQPPDAPAYEIVDALDVRDRPVVSRTTFNKWGDELDEATQGSRKLVVTGVSTECCVLTTVLAAADAGVQVTVVRDAVAGPTPELRDASLAVMETYAPLVQVVSTGDLPT
ncbi:cysteine hydrolase family protein [Solicola gregarius]|uniref:Cysteine hydrolase n=1 Tax=Solicola gregarius TaxID=2908642 RepID=A0AA46YL69_9ACTN|nr:cysteine hydrolase [Solicola gregarius]UYM06600.1 cysteine hydrolase [Solicola gregarius]